MKCDGIIRVLSCADPSRSLSFPNSSPWHEPWHVRNVMVGITRSKVLSQACTSDVFHLFHGDVSPRLSVAGFFTRTNLPPREVPMLNLTDAIISFCLSGRYRSRARCGRTLHGSSLPVLHHTSLGPWGCGWRSIDLVKVPTVFGAPSLRKRAVLLFTQRRCL